MAFRASIATQSNALMSIMQMAMYVKGTCNNAIAQLAGNVTPDQIWQMVDNLRAALASMNASAAVPGLANYAQAQFNDATYNISTEYTTMVNSINAVINWVVANFPVDTGGFAQAYKINADGSRLVTQFTPAQTTGLVTALNNCVATIA